MKHQDDFLEPKEQREVFLRLMAYLKGHKGSLFFHLSSCYLEQEPNLLVRF